MLLRPFYYLFVRTLGLAACSLVFTTTGFAQTTDMTVYTIVEQPPQFPAGFEAMKNYLLTNVHYPSEAKKAGVKNRVFVSFVVEIDGRLTNVTILKGLGYGCDEEAIRLVKAMPRWIPGGQSGMPLRVKYNLPVLFGMDYPKSKKY